MWDKKPPVTEGTFIDEYLRFMEGQETSYVYDLVCSLFCLGAACSRRVFVDRPRAPVYLNVFAILAAESGVTRKSTAVRIAREVTSNFIAKSPAHYRMFESKTTPESLEWTLMQMGMDNGYANAAVVVSELVTFLGKEKYNLAMPGLLTDLFDSPSLRTGSGTLSRGVTILRNVYLSFLSASTPSWLVRAINPDVIEGGFTSRCLFIVDETPKRSIPWPASTDMELHYAQLGDHLLSLWNRLFHNLPDGETLPIVRSISAASTFDEWYRGREQSRDPFRASFEGREDAHILKIAGLLALNNGRLEINEEEILYAIQFIQWAKVQASYIFAYSTDDKLVMGIDRIRTTLIGAGLDGMVQSELYKRVVRYIDSAQMSYALSILHEMGMVQQFEERNLSNPRGRPRTRWRATELITQQGVITAVLDQWERIK